VLRLIITSSEIQNNFGKYLKLAETEEVVITKNGKKVAQLTPYSGVDTPEHWVVGESPAAYKKAGVRVTYEEFLKIAEDGENRYEYIDGEIYLLGSPVYAHQKAVREILGEFIVWFRGKNCEPLTSPFDVTLFKGEKKDNACVVQPDIFVICDRENIDEKGQYHGTPALVVEVLSDSTRGRDLIKKLDLYLESGVQEYWIVNTESAEIYLYVLKNQAIEKILSFKGDEDVQSVIFHGLSVSLKQVFSKSR
jgi:prevent-host-death family protein